MSQSQASITNIITMTLPHSGNAETSLGSPNDLVSLYLAIPQIFLKNTILGQVILGEIILTEVLLYEVYIGGSSIGDCFIGGFLRETIL